MKTFTKRTAIILGLITALTLFMSSGCARVGQDFNANKVTLIKIGETTQDDIIKMFGQPWRKGMQNGVVMWTYGRYTYRVIGETDTKDLVIKFDNDKKVISYTFNTTD